MRTLIVIRHAKAESSAPSDHDRELTPRGHGDAAAAGRWLAGRGITPDLALVSSAARTQQTWEDVATEAGWELEVAESLDPLYTASTESALDLIREVEDAHTAVVVVGHNPTMSSLVQLLDDGQGDEAAGNELALGYPTSGVTVLEFDGAWAELEEASAAVLAFHVGRG